jgi:hypothetical protein
VSGVVTEVDHAAVPRRRALEVDGEYDRPERDRAEAGGERARPEGPRCGQGGDGHGQGGQSEEAEDDGPRPRGEVDGGQGQECPQDQDDEADRGGGGGGRAGQPPRERHLESQHREQPHERHLHPFPGREPHLPFGAPDPRAPGQKAGKILQAGRSPSRLPARPLLHLPPLDSRRRELGQDQPAMGDSLPHSARAHRRDHVVVREVAASRRAPDVDPPAVGYQQPRVHSRERPAQTADGQRVVPGHENGRCRVRVAQRHQARRRPVREHPEDEITDIGHTIARAHRVPSPRRAVTSSKLSQSSSTCTSAKPAARTRSPRPSTGRVVACVKT